MLPAHIEEPPDRHAVLFLERRDLLAVREATAVCRSVILTSAKKKLGGRQVARERVRTYRRVTIRVARLLRAYVRLFEYRINRRSTHAQAP